MKANDIWIFQIVSNEILASDRIGATANNGYLSPVLDTNNGGADDLTILGWEITPSYSLIKIKRKLITH